MTLTFGARKLTGVLGAATVVTVAQYLLVLTDTVIAGRVLGEAALGAHCLLTPLFTLATFCTTLLAFGTAMSYANALGKLQRTQANAVASQGMVAALVLGLALAGIIFLVSGPYCAALAGDRVTGEFARSFLRWYPLVALLEAVELTLLYVTYTDGGERLALFAYVTQLLTNIALSYGLSDGRWGLPAWGMEGVCLGTVYAQALGVLMLVPGLLHHRGRGFRFAFRYRPRELVGSLRASLGGVSSDLYQVFLFAAVILCIVFKWGAETLPVAAVVFCIVRLTNFFNGVGIALQPLESAYHGEGNDWAVRRLVRFASVIAVAESLLAAGVILIAPELLVSFFGIEDPELTAASMRAARLTVLGLSGYAVTYLLNSHYWQVGCVGRSVGLMAMAFCVIPAVLLLVLGSVSGMDGVWIAVALGPACSLVALLPFRRREAELPQPTLMWSVDLARTDATVHLLRAVGDAVAGRCPEAAAERLTDVLALSCKRLVTHNRAARTRRRRNVHAEVSVLFGSEAVVLVVRDDGRPLALEDVGAQGVHLPEVGFNRNVFTFPIAKEAGQFLKKRAKASRYAVVRGRDVPLADIEKIIELDRGSLDAQYQVTAEADHALFRANYENGLVVKEAATGKVVGYSMLVPVRDDVYDLIRTGRFVDTDLTPDMLVTYDRPGLYKLYFASVVVHPEFRSASLVLTMLDAMVEDFIALSERGIFIEKMMADVVSRDGEKFCRLFGLSEVCATDHGSHIYEVSGLPPEFRVTTPATERLSGLYWERYAAMRQAEG